MKFFTKLINSTSKFFKRSSYHPEVDREFIEPLSPASNEESRHTNKRAPLSFKEIDDKYDPLIEHVRNQKEKK